MHEKYPHGEDPWGLNLEKTQKVAEMLYPLYKDYFKVRLFEKKCKKQALYCCCKSLGQIAIDGLLLGSWPEIYPPRILRGMIERFVTNLPFLGTWTAETGAVLGDRQNCSIAQAWRERSCFPEGVNGVAKSTPDYYKLQKFTKGFYRIALSAQVEILPGAVVGAEETLSLCLPSQNRQKLGLPLCHFPKHALSP